MKNINENGFLKEKIVMKLLPVFLFLFAGIFVGQAQTAVQIFNDQNAENVKKLYPASNSSVRAVEEVCTQKTFGNDIENGLGDLIQLIYANDLIVSAGENFTLEALSFRLLIEIGTTVQSVDFTFYDDSGNGPGNEIESLPGMVPVLSETVGSVNNFNLLELSFELPDEIFLEGSGVPTVYWVGVTIQSNSLVAYMEVTSIMNTLHEIYYLSPTSGVWISSATSDAEGGFGEAYDGVISFYGHCDELPACNGQPEAGEIVQGDFEICPETSFNLSLTGVSVSGSGVNGIWQMRPAGGSEAEWEDIAGANALVLQMENGITQDLDFRYFLECEAIGLFDVTDAITVEILPPNECYCEPVHAFGCFLGPTIEKVFLNGENYSINNSTGCSQDGFEVYPELIPADLVAGNVYSVIITTDEVDIPMDKKIIGWIDFDQDGVFDPFDLVFETGMDGMTDHVQSFSFLLPEDLDLGVYRMRISLTWNDYLTDACEGATYGETEDYFVEIIEVFDCEGQPVAGTASASVSEICPDNAFGLEVTGSSISAIGLERKWQSSPAGEGDWTDLPNSGSSYYLVPGITTDTDYRYVVYCENSGLADSTLAVTVNVLPTDECYCIPEYSFECTDYGDAINKVVLAGMSVELNNPSECDPSTNYSDYTNLPAPDLAPGETYLIQIYSSSPDAMFEEVKAWIDYNQNGKFDENEIIANTNGNGLGDFQGFEFTIPGEAEFGFYRLRVRLGYGDVSMDGCSSGAWGETEDYLVEIAEPVGLNDAKQTFSGFKFFPNPTKDVLILESEEAVQMVEIYDLTGRKVMHAPVSQNLKQIYVGSLKPGVYLMKVSIENYSSSYRFVKM